MVTLSNGNKKPFFLSARAFRWALLLLSLALVATLLWAHGMVARDGATSASMVHDAAGGSATESKKETGGADGDGVPPKSLTASASSSSLTSTSTVKLVKHIPASKESPQYKYDTSSFTSQSRSSVIGCDPPPEAAPSSPASDPPPPAGHFFSQQSARSVLKEFVEKRTAEAGKPRFIPALNELYHAAQSQGRTFVTVQLGGMDGKTGDPMYRFAQFNTDISHWMPVVVEPVPENFSKLVEIYKGHRNRINGSRRDEGSLTCPHVLHQMVNYDTSFQSPPGSGTCPFCHFDHDKEECKNQPNWMKYETGSMECDSESKKKCFLANNYVCTTIRQALEAVGLHPRDVAAIQIDVEGFEQMMLEGYFGEIAEEEWPPIINFESKILKGRKQYGAVDKFLRERGYGMHEKRVDALAIWGVQGL